jgi:hypothetical protein
MREEQLHILHDIGLLQADVRPMRATLDEVLEDSK